MTDLAHGSQRLLVLWDVDHTLIENSGISKQVYASAFRLLVGRAPDREAVTEGRTDIAIMRSLLLACGEPGVDDLGQLSWALSSAMRAHAAELAQRGWALPGAERVLAALRDSSDVVQAVITGNVRANAIAKLSAFGLARYIDFDSGGYGLDGLERRELVDAARRRATVRAGVEFAGVSTVVIGDTPRDVQAGLDAGAFVLGVATGKYGISELQTEGAHAVLQDLKDTADVLRLVRGSQNWMAARDPRGVPVDWAHRVAEEHLRPLGDRWRHSIEVGDQARRMARIAPGPERQLLIAAALLHDIGYAPTLAITGFHPLDGARWLRGQGVPDRLCALVAHHTCARVEARLRGLVRELNAEFPLEESVVADTLTCADMTVGPTGAVTAVEDRLAEILIRYPAGHVVHSAITEAGSQLIGTVRRVQACLTRSSFADAPEGASDSDGTA